MKILLLGASGMLGSDCLKVFSESHDVVAPTKKELNIIKWDLVIEKLQTVSPDVVVNCAAFTDVDACESDDKMISKINVEGPRNLAQACARFHCKFVQISSDYVFDGTKPFPQPYFEDDPPHPISAYGKQKMESEVAVRENSPNYIIVRTAWLYGINGKNFMTSILKKALETKGDTLKVANDQWGSPTWTYRVAQQILKLIEQDARGIYHATAEGYCTRYDWAKFFIQRLGIKVKVEPCSMKDFPQKAKRPVNCLLENRNLKEQGLNVMRPWKEDLSLFLEHHGQRLIEMAKES